MKQSTTLRATVVVALAALGSARRLAGDDHLLAVPADEKSATQALGPGSVAIMQPRGAAERR